MKVPCDVQRIIKIHSKEANNHLHAERMSIVLAKISCITEVHNFAFKFAPLGKPFVRT